MPMTKSTLKTALPTMVPKPTADRLNVPTNDVASSGADPPAAMSVAPATSSLSSHFSAMTSSAGTKSSSQMIAMARKRYSTPMMQPTVTPHPRFSPQSSSASRRDRPSPAAAPAAAAANDGARPSKTRASGAPCAARFAAQAPATTTASAQALTAARRICRPQRGRQGGGIMGRYVVARYLMTNFV